MNDNDRVIAAPFRAHLQHVSASTSLPWPVLALHAGVPLGLARALLDLRPGRVVQRISPELARQVLAINEQVAKEVREPAIGSRTSRQALRRLLSHGWSTQRLAQRLHVSRGLLDGLLNGLVIEVPRLVELQLCALLAMAPTTAVAPASRLQRAA